jgi:hypothetical protein
MARPVEALLTVTTLPILAGYRLEAPATSPIEAVVHDRVTAKPPPEAHEHCACHSCGGDFDERAHDYVFVMPNVKLTGMRQPAAAGPE